jgi:two-component system sensor histidine kinase CssS
MRKQISESEKIKREMLQNISHDFKTPIAVIKSYAEAQQDGMADEDSNKIIINQAEILKNKVNRLLQYNYLEYLSKDKEFEDVNMKEVIEEVIQGYKFQTDLDIPLGIYIFNLTLYSVSAGGEETNLHSESTILYCGN